MVVKKTPSKTKSPDFPWLKSYSDQIDWNYKYKPEPLTKIWDDTVVQHKDHVALDFLDKTWTYQDLDQMVTQAAAGLSRLGITKGKKVGLLLPNTPYYIVAYYAILKIGGVVVNYNPLYATDEIIHQINDSDTEILVTLDLKILYNKVKTCLRETKLRKVVVCPFDEILPTKKKWLFRFFQPHKRIRIFLDQRHVSWAQLTDNDGKFIAADINPEKDIALLQYTGGTTGVPKGAMLTHGNLYINTQQAGHWFGDKITPGQDVMMGVLPFFHVFSMTTVMNFSILFGLKIIATPRFDLKELLGILDKKKPTLFPAVPTIYAAINHYKKITRYDLSSIRYCISGGAPLPVEVKKQFEDLTGCLVLEGYGLTETSPVACCNPAFGENKTGSIGLPLPGTIIEISNLTDPEKIYKKVNLTGEICIRGPQVMAGYYKKPDATKDILRKGRLHTGDIGYIDKDGYIFIVDRLKDMILSGGYNVYPRNIEEAIYKHDAVEECIVAGIKDDLRGERIKAWVKLKDRHQLSEEDLKAFLKPKLALYEIPSYIEFRNEPLPKTLIGKLSRKDILAEESQR